MFFWEVWATYLGCAATVLQVGFFPSNGTKSEHVLKRRPVPMFSGA